MTPVIQSGITELASENVSGVYVDEQEKQKDLLTAQLPLFHFQTELKPVQNLQQIQTVLRPELRWLKSVSNC